MGQEPAGAARPVGGDPRLQAGARQAQNSVSPPGQIRPGRQHQRPGGVLRERAGTRTLGRQAMLAAADRLIGAGFSTNRERPSLNFSSGAWQKAELSLGDTLRWT